MSAAWVNVGLLVIAVAGLAWWGKRPPREDDRPESQYWDDQSAP